MQCRDKPDTRIIDIEIGITVNEISNPAKYYKKKQKYVAIREFSKLSNTFKETTIYQTIFRVGTQLSILKNILLTCLFFQKNVRKSCTVKVNCNRHRCFPSLIRPG